MGANKEGTLSPESLKSHRLVPTEARSSISMSNSTQRPLPKRSTGQLQHQRQHLAIANTKRETRYQRIRTPGGPYTGEVQLNHNSRQHAKRPKTIIDQPCVMPNGALLDKTELDKRPNTFPHKTIQTKLGKSSRVDLTQHCHAPE